MTKKTCLKIYIVQSPLQKPLKKKEQTSIALFKYANSN